MLYTLQRGYIYIELRKFVTSESALKRNFEFVVNLLTNTDFDASKIAALAQVPVAYVKQVKKKIG